MILILKGWKFFSFVAFMQLMQTIPLFFLKKENSIVHVSEKFNLFSDFLGLRPSTAKCKIAGIGVLKGVQAV